MRDERQIMHDGDGQRAMFSPVVWSQSRMLRLRAWVGVPDPGLGQFLLCRWWTLRAQGRCIHTILFSRSSPEARPG